MTQIQDDIAFFFTEPEVAPEAEGDVSVLYLLRRDIKQCIDNETILFPATMAILAGIDLLGKFHSGKDTSPGVGERFKEFVKTYFQQLTPDNAEVLYQLRNALLHSFGLYSRTLKGHVYRFFLVFEAIGGTLIGRERDGNIYIISIKTLYDRFERAIAQYHESLKTDQDLQQNFSRMFLMYGKIWRSAPK